MFENIGQKIKGLAKFICAVGIIASVLGGGSIIANDSDLTWLGLIIIIGGSLLSYVSTFVLYGFGQLVENSDIMADLYKKQLTREKARAAAQLSEKNKTKINDPNVRPSQYVDFYCPHCGETISYTKQDIIFNKTLECPMCCNTFETNTLFK